MSSVALTDAIETIAGRDNPCIVCWPAKPFSEVFEDCWIFGRDIGEIVEPLIDSARETRRSHIVSEDAAIDHLSKKTSIEESILLSDGEYSLVPQAQKSPRLSPPPPKVTTPVFCCGGRAAARNGANPSTLLPTPAIATDRKKIRRLRALCWAIRCRMSVRMNL